jgi:hypothetical protein
MQYGSFNPITRANNPNPAYGGYMDDTAGHAHLPPIPVATGYTHPDVRYHGVSIPQYPQQQQLLQLRQHFDDQYERVRQAQQYMQRPQNLTTDTLTHLYNLPEPTRALTWYVPFIHHTYALSRLMYQASDELSDSRRSSPHPPIGPFHSLSIYSATYPSITLPSRYER